MDEILQSKTVTRDIIELMIGKNIGFGAGRQVYECLLDDSLVVKVEAGSGSFQNVIEWKLWNEIEHTPFAKWFAPCVSISPCGTVLLQKKCEALPMSEYPSKIPHFFTDTKYTNFGVLKKRFVCFDYGSLIFARGMTTKMQKADWWKA